jgi:predicted small integral membrane protein
MLSWMVWTTPVAVFFACVGLLLVVMTAWELRSPTVMRKGFLPVATTRGDRLFIGLVAAGYINLIWLGLGGRMMDWFSLAEEPSAWIGAGFSAIVLAVIMSRG